MNYIYVFILRNDIWIYIIAVLGLLWYGNEYLRSRRILKKAMFGLEREQGSRIRNNALFFMFLLGAIISIVYYVNSQVAPTLPAEILKPPTPTPNIFSTPLSSPTPLSTTAPTAAPSLVPTITLASNDGLAPPSANTDANTAVSESDALPTEEIGTPLPPPTPEVDCNVRLNITDPRNGAVVPSTVTFFGTVDVDDFSYFRLEANGPQTSGQWANLLGRNVDQRIVDGLLGSANLEQWASGPYLIRLTTVNENGYDTAQCIIQITLEN